MQRMDQRDVVLLALYSEYLKDEGDFRRVTSRALEMTGRAFAWALMRLQTEGLIAGCVFQPPGAGSAEQIMGVLRDGLYMTGAGVEKCEALLAVSREARDATKLTKLAQLLHDVGANVIAGLITAYLDN